jgi:hypothetical protein
MVCSFELPDDVFEAGEVRPQKAKKTKTGKSKSKNKKRGIDETGLEVSLLFSGSANGGSLSIQAGEDHGWHSRTMRDPEPCEVPFPFSMLITRSPLQSTTPGVKRPHVDQATTNGTATAAT